MGRADIVERAAVKIRRALKEETPELRRLRLREARDILLRSGLGLRRAAAVALTRVGRQLRAEAAERGQGRAA